MEDTVKKGSSYQEIQTAVEADPTVRSITTKGDKVIIVYGTPKKPKKPAAS